MRHLVAKSGVFAGVVWWSTPQSVAAGHVSLLACAEVVFSVAAYWLIAWWFDTALHLLISVCIAPLVLFRSEASVATGLRLWRRWQRNDAPEPDMARRAMATGPFVALAALSGWAVLEVSPAASGAGNVTVLTVFAMVAGGGLAGALHIGIFGLRYYNAAGQAWFVSMVFLAPLAAGLGALAHFPVGDIALTDLIALAVVFLGAGLVAIGVSIGGGLWLAALAIRITSTLAHLAKGLARAGPNWQRTVLWVDLCHPPELLPDMAKCDETGTFEAMWTPVMDRDRRVAIRLAYLLTIAIWAVPTVLYRYALKSTCWLYLPIFYVARIPARLSDAGGRALFLRAHTRTFVEWGRFIVAGLGLAVAAAALVDGEQVRAAIGLRGEDSAILTPYHYLLVVDWSRLEPYHMVSLPSGLLTVALFLWVDGLRKWEMPAMHWQVTAALLANNLRNLLVLVWCALSLHAFAGDAFRLCKLPEAMGWLEVLYGPAGCAGSGLGPGIGSGTG